MAISSRNFHRIFDFHVKRVLKEIPARKLPCRVGDSTVHARFSFREFSKLLTWFLCSSAIVFDELNVKKLRIFLQGSALVGHNFTATLSRTLVSYMEFVG